MSYDADDPASASNIERSVAVDLLLVDHRYIEIRHEEQDRAVEVLRRDAEDREGMLVQAYDAAHDAAIALKTALPETVAQDDVRRAIRPALVGGVEEAAEIRLQV